MLLATDLDGTFLGGSATDRHQLYQLIARHPDIKLAYVTGRGLETVLPLLSDPSLPQPDYIICDVGASVVDGATLQAIQPLQSEIAGRWPGEQLVAGAFSRFHELVRQATPQQRRCSYFCDEEVITGEMHSVAAGLECDLLFSAAKYLDVLPKGVNKGATLVALVDALLQAAQRGVDLIDVHFVESFGVVKNSAGPGAETGAVVRSLNCSLGLSLRGSQWRRGRRRRRSRSACDRICRSSRDAARVVLLHRRAHARRLRRTDDRGRRSRR